MGGSFAPPALGTAAPRLRRRGSRPRGLLAREDAGRRWGPADRRGARGSPAGSPRRLEDDLRRGRRPARRAPEPSPVRRNDRHGRDPLGRRATADRLDRAARPTSTPAPLASSWPVATCTSSVPRRPKRSRSGRGSVPGGASRRSRRSRRSLTAVRTPVGDAWILTRDEPTFRAAPGPAAPARLLPSGDAYFLLQGADRQLLVPDATVARELWTSRVWPGALLVEGEVAGTWRRAQGRLTIDAWRRLSRAARDAVEAEAASLPLPGLEGRVVVSWKERRLR